MKQKQMLIEQLTNLKPHKPSQAKDAVQVKVQFVAGPTKIAFIAIDDLELDPDVEGIATTKIKPGEHVLSFGVQGLKDHDITVAFLEPFEFVPAPPYHTNKKGFVSDNIPFTV
jgi:hypothetical protein